ncbi:MAG TPA: hypothetical protein ENK18_11790 [Deltaproteobacteria bacterium]|nr:hypothetical protein [Deltaproteobacteria bacterium]
MDALIRWSWTLALAGALSVAGALVSWLLTSTLEGPPTWLAGAGGLLLLAYAGLDRERLGEAAQTRGFTYGAGSSLLLVLAAGLATSVYLLARNNDTTWDLTRDRSYSLSDQALRVASSLDTDVSVTAFFGRGSPGIERFRSQITLFQQASDRISVEFVDPLRQPTRAAAAEITGDHGTVLFETGSGDTLRTQRLEWEITEEEIVRALVLLKSGETHRVCWSMGHGEPDPDDEFSESGLGGIRLELERLNYQVTKQRIAQEGIDRACEVLILARPQQDWLEFEREALAAHLAEGRHALVLLDPWLAPELARDLERYGLLVGADEVRDANLKNQLLGVDDMSVVVLSEEDFTTHPITRNLLAAIVLPGARSVTPMLEAPGVEVQALAHTSPQAWGETDPTTLPSEPDPSTETIGSIPVVSVSVVTDPEALAVAASSAGQAAAPLSPDALQGNAGRAVPADLAPVAGGRLVVIGDSDFASNGFVSWGNNRDLFLNTLAWMVEEEDQIGERPEQGDTLEISALGETVLCLISLVLVPGSAAGLAVMTLVRRRYL